jgi:hypothetical protein
MRCYGPLAALLVALAAAPGVPAPIGTAMANHLDRVQLHRNSNRGVPYLPLARHGQSAGASKLSMRVIRKIQLDGDPLQNVYSNVRPIDIDGDGDFEFVQYNGYRFMQVWSGSGQKLWRVSTGGRLHNYKAGTHRDTVAILDLDGDGKQDIAHCWTQGGRKILVYRRGRDGKVIHSRVLNNDEGQECQIAAFRLADTRNTLILVSHRLTSKPSCSGGNYIDTWAQTVAFDRQQRQVWSTRTCDAGHYAYPLDANYDGYAEGIFVGKYLLRANGSVKCKLSSWPAADHVDSLAVADLDTSRRGVEVVAVGQSGLAMFDPDSCRQIWRISTSVVRNPQHVAVAKLDPASSAPLLIVEEKGTVNRGKTFIINGKGKILDRQLTVAMPMQNANIDGARGVDEHVGSFGTITDRKGNVRLGRSWYWGLKGTRVRETFRGPYPTSYDRWQPFPLVFDFDRDGRDDIVTWGQSLLVVGKKK